MRDPPRYEVRDARGRVLTVRSLAELATLHREGLVADGDEVRRAGGGAWTRADEVPALRAVRPRSRDRRWAWAVLTAALALAIALALRRSGGPPAERRPPAAGQRP